jgi:hypothetical protein
MGRINIFLIEKLRACYFASVINFFYALASILTIQNIAICVRIIGMLVKFLECLLFFYFNKLFEPWVRDYEYKYLWISNVDSLMLSNFIFCSVPALCIVRNYKWHINRILFEIFVSISAFLLFNFLVVECLN